MRQEGDLDISKGLRVEGALNLKQIATPIVPKNGEAQLYIDANGVLKLHDGSTLSSIAKITDVGANGNILAFVNFSATGIGDNLPCTINKSSGVTSVTRTKNGSEYYYDILFSTPLADANYCAHINGRGVSPSTCFVGMETHGASALRSTTHLRIYCLGSDFSYISPEKCSVTIIG